MFRVRRGGSAEGGEVKGGRGTFAVVGGDLFKVELGGGC